MLGSQGRKTGERAEMPRRIVGEAGRKKGMLGKKIGADRAAGRIGKKIRAAIGKAEMPDRNIEGNEKKEHTGSKKEREGGKKETIDGKKAKEAGKRETIDGKKVKEAGKGEHN